MDDDSRENENDFMVVKKHEGEKIGSTPHAINYTCRSRRSFNEKKRRGIMEDSYEFITDSNIQ